MYIIWHKNSNGEAAHWTPHHDILMIPEIWNALFTRIRKKCKFDLYFIILCLQRLQSNLLPKVHNHSANFIKCYPQKSSNKMWNDTDMILYDRVNLNFQYIPVITVFWKTNGSYISQNFKYLTNMQVLLEPMLAVRRWSDIICAHII